LSELAPLIEDLAFILVLAGIVTIFCKKFNQPLVLGYILAGFFASPHFNLLPNVVDTANITVWSDIGVIFILFSLGLDFNFAKIKSIGGPQPPATKQVNSFTDVAADAYYYGAVAWAAEEGITGGTSATTFSPNADCTRAQIVTFLYRYLAD